jgi:cysteinyl-tRNA synthetase
VREITVRDTLSREPQPIETGREVAIYACGPTVYSRIHIGNARPFVVFSLFARFLRAEGYRVRLVMNITDINDKIYLAAREADQPSDDLAASMSRAYIEDTDRLELGRPDAEPLASETIEDIVELIEALIERGHAYESGGDVYFRVRSFEGYGKLSNRDPADMDQGEEAGSESLKEDLLDFALWKGHKQDEDTSWPSPWGPGRPGWHIECSAMAEAEVDELPLEVHGGGSDLVFPHHENELAQTEAGRGKPLARIWMHNGMVETDAEKMSKSEGNIFQLSEALDRYGREAVVAYLLSGHYRQPLAFGPEPLEEAARRVEGLRNFFRENGAEGEPGEEAGAYRERFLDALADDFNTPRALAVLAELVAEGNRRELPGAGAALASMLELLGLESLAEVGEEADEEAQRLLAERGRAREDGRFEDADRIRDQLAEHGWEVRDSAEGARLVRRGGD